MHLHEEYIRRHKLDVPVIRYNQRSKILLRNDSLPNWRILSLDWQSDYAHPGYWLCSLIEPIHASFGRDRNWRQLFRPRQIFWDQYDGFMKSLAADHCGWTVTQNQLDSELFCWEVLLYTCDNWVSHNMRENRAFLKNMAMSIDKKFSLDDRLASFQEAFRIVQNTSMSVAEFYSYNICNHHGDGQKWFSELISNESKKLLARAS